MAHIVYGGQRFALQEGQHIEILETLQRVFDNDSWARLTTIHADGDKSILFVSRATPVVVNDWDLNELGI